MNVAKKIILLLLLAGFTISCSPKRAPSRGCDCPSGHGMIEKKGKELNTAMVFSNIHNSI